MCVFLALSFTSLSATKWVADLHITSFDCHQRSNIVSFLYQFFTKAASVECSNVLDKMWLNSVWEPSKCEFLISILHICLLAEQQQSGCELHMWTKFLRNILWRFTVRCSRKWVLSDNLIRFFKWVSWCLLCGDYGCFVLASVFSFVVC